MVIEVVLYNVNGWLLGSSGRVVARLLCKVARVFWEICQGVLGGC